MTAESATEYVLGADDTERKRLLQQGETYQTEAGLLLDRLGVEPGWDVLDAGCGPLGILDLLSERVGPTGSVTGMDQEPRMLDMAAQSLAERRLVGVRLLAADAAATGLPDASFDLVHERLVLLNVVQTEKDRCGAGPAHPSGRMGRTSGVRHAVVVLRAGARRLGQVAGRAD